MKAIEVGGARIVGTREGAVNVYGLPASIALTLAGVAEYAARQAFEDDAALARLADALEQAAGYAEDPPPAWTAVYRYETEYGPGDEDDEQLDSEQEALDRLRVSGPDGTESDLVPVALVRPDGTRVESAELRRLLWPPLHGPERPPAPGVCVQVQHPCEVPPPDDVAMDGYRQGLRLTAKRRRPGERVLTAAWFADSLEAAGYGVRWHPPAAHGQPLCRSSTLQVSLLPMEPTALQCGRPARHRGRHAAYDGDTILVTWS